MSRSSHKTQVRRKYKLYESQHLDDGAWTKHTDFHWSRTVNGERLDYWPSTQRWHYKGRKYTYLFGSKGGYEGFDGDINKFIADTTTPR